jgi:hypothetical protein
MSEDPDEHKFDESLDEDMGAPEPVRPVSSKTPQAARPAIQSKTPKAAAGGGEQLTLYFTSTIGPGEKKQKMQVKPANTVGAIKRTVGSMFGLDPDEFHLSYGGVTLEDSEPLSNYNAQNGDTLLLIPASTAG